jgi:hypothetical protein
MPTSYDAAMGFESLTVADTAVGVTFADADEAERAFMTLETGQIRFRYDGVSPTASEGHLMEIGDVFVLEGGGNITAFEAIRTGGTSGVLKITYER